MAQRKSQSTETTDVPVIEGGSFPTLPLPLPIPYPPMEAKRVDAVPAKGDWLFEPKWDGFRAIVFRASDSVVIQSKSGQPLGRYFPELIEAFRALPHDHFVLDGEIVIPIEGHLSFDDLLQRIHPAESRIRKLSAQTPAQYFAFDLLVEDGRSLVGEPLAMRRERLDQFFESEAQRSPIKLSPATTDRNIAEEWFRDFGDLGLDGVMAKKISAPYHSGDRNGMVKVKHLITADCVVGGYRYASGSTAAIGSLLLGLYDEQKRLVFVGHTSSFNKEQKVALREVVEPLRGENPFEVRVPGGPSRWATEKSGEWEAVKPQLVCEVEYDYYSQHRFRHGTKFLRWRPEKAPESCTMEQVDPARRKGTLEKLGMM
ncbi:MAG: ATP-dependent DNA ligase [Acidobacteriota bacterium]